MWIQYQQFESYAHLLRHRLRPGGDRRPVRCVVFGGTGAVGGAVVLDLLRLILRSKVYRDPPLTAQIWATGVSDHEIATFVGRLYSALEDECRVEKLVPLRHYRFDGRAEVRFDHLRLAAPADLEEMSADLAESSLTALTAESAKEASREIRAKLVARLEERFDSSPSPFLSFVESLEEELGGEGLLDGVVVGIPLPSVVTYTVTSIERLAERHGLGPQRLQQVKESFLAAFVRGLAVIRQRHARRVVMAHTTGVGGMFSVDGAAPEIRLGFAHSAIGRKLVEKKHHADTLSRIYRDHGLDVLVTAAAIGIDAVEFHCRLPMVPGVKAVLRRAVEDGSEAIPTADLEGGFVRLYPALSLPLEAAGEEPPVRFGAGKDLRVEAAIRSGENGLFSVANCTALYHVMKVAIPEELGSVIVRRVVFDQERRCRWFRENLCYYAETENAHFAHRVLESDQRLVRAHLGGLSVQAFQALGSSTHQARLHELGLATLLLRLKSLGRRLPDLSAAQVQEGLQDLESFLWCTTEVPCFEDLLELGAEALSRQLTALCELKDHYRLGELIGYDPRALGLREPIKEKLLHRLATHVERYRATITSLGIPILYRCSRSGRTRAFVGPYLAPLDLAVTGPDSLHRGFVDMARSESLPLEAVRDWVVANNGFIDLRPHAVGTSDKSPEPGLGQRLLRTEDPQEFDAWLRKLEPGSYFTTAGVLALDLRLRRLWAQLRGRRIELGTANCWKNLFFRQEDGKFVLAPGLVETCRMYCEGLGKVTGTEQLWPDWGYGTERGVNEPRPPASPRVVEADARTGAHADLEATEVPA